MSSKEGRTSQLKERDITLEVHHQGHHDRLDGHPSLAAEAGLEQAVELFELGELSFDLGAFPPGLGSRPGSG